MAHQTRQDSLRSEEEESLLSVNDVDPEKQRERGKPKSPDFFVFKIAGIELRLSALGTLFILLLAGLASWQGLKLFHAIDTPARSSKPFAHLAAHCSKVSPISSSEFYARQTRLAQRLAHLNASAYVAEPGANAAYFGNITSSSWHLSERPLLLIITPDLSDPYSVKPKVSILTPSFEATRAKLIPVPAAGNITYASWPEDADPYKIAASVISGSGTVFVDAAVRHFIVDGLQSTGANVQSAPIEVRRLRERKTEAELAIMKCVNEVTLFAIRAVREKMYIGMRESEANAMIRSALSAAGLTNGGGLVLFGENAALPHGSGSDRALGKSDFALFDVGGELHSYVSDVTRTFALKDTKLSGEQTKLWDLVHKSQTEASGLKNGSITREVDEAGRKVIEDAGYGQYFTHRLGHGIGIEGHESPYLRGGSDDIILTGHAFSNEPGIYIEGQVGVRLEDCFYVDNQGDFVFLTAGVGGQASSPWSL